MDWRGRPPCFEFVGKGWHPFPAVLRGKQWWQPAQLTNETTPFPSQECQQHSTRRLWCKHSTTFFGLLSTWGIVSWNSSMLLWRQRNCRHWFGISSVTQQPLPLCSRHIQMQIQKNLPNLFIFTNFVKHACVGRLMDSAQNAVRSFSFPSKHTKNAQNRSTCGSCLIRMWIYDPYSWLIFGNYMHISHVLICMRNSKFA